MAETASPKTALPEVPRGYTFEDVWAALMEDKERNKELREQMGALHNRFGEMAEHLVAPGIKKKFNELGFNFTGNLRDWEIREPGNPNASAEIDILLENCDIAVAVEVKVKPKQADVDDHLRRMEIVRKVTDMRGDRRKFYGAIAGAIMSDSVRAYALKCGLYVLEQSGDTMQMSIPENFVPREW